MDDDLPIEPSLSGWHLSLQRLAAWITRGNGCLNRVGSRKRAGSAAHQKLGPSRQQLPPRP